MYISRFVYFLLFVGLEIGLRRVLQILTLGFRCCHGDLPRLVKYLSSSYNMTLMILIVIMGTTTMRVMTMIMIMIIIVIITVHRHPHLHIKYHISSQNVVELNWDIKRVAQINIAAPIWYKYWYIRQPNATVLYIICTPLFIIQPASCTVGIIIMLYDMINAHDFFSIRNDSSGASVKKWYLHSF